MRYRAISWRTVAFLTVPVILVAATSATAMGSRGGELLASEEYRGVQEIVVESDSFEVNVVGTQTDSTSISVVGSRSVHASIRRRGHRVVVEANERRALFSRSRVGGSIDIQTFEGITLEIEVGSGDIDARGLQGGVVDLATGSGDIVARSIFGESSFRTGSGELRMERVGGEVDAATGSGQITLLDSEGRLSLSSSSGNVTVRAVSGDVNASSTSGIVLVTDAEGTFTLASTSGGVFCKGLRLRSSSRFSTISGDIELQLAQEPELFSYRLSSVSGEIAVGNTRSRGRLERDGGRRVIEASTVSGSIRIE